MPDLARSRSIALGSNDEYPLPEVAGTVKMVFDMGKLRKTDRHASLPSL